MAVKHVQTSDIKRAPAYINAGHQRSVPGQRLAEQAAPAADVQNCFVSKAGALRNKVGSWLVAVLPGPHFTSRLPPAPGKSDRMLGLPCINIFVPVLHQSVTRERYSPLRVSTLMTSPSWTNNGTRTVAPVSRWAGLPPLPEVSPRRPGSVSTILSSTKLGGVTTMG